MKHLLIELSSALKHSRALRAHVVLDLDDGNHYALELKVKNIDILTTLEVPYPKIVIEGVFINDEPSMSSDGFFNLDPSTERKMKEDFIHMPMKLPTLPTAKKEGWSIVGDDTIDFSHVGHTFEEAMRNLIMVDKHIDRDAAMDTLLTSEELKRQLLSYLASGE